MDGSTILWIVLAIVALLVIAALVYFATRKQKDVRRGKAKALREDASSRAEALPQRRADKLDPDSGHRNS